MVLVVDAQPDVPCRFCGASLDDVFVDLGMSPLANSYIPLDRAGAMEPFYPLCALVCGECFLVQLSSVQSAEHIFDEHYAYFSSYSSSWLEHCRSYVEQMAARLKLKASSQVVEIASNDGYLLQYFVERDIPVLGIEPAANTAQVAIEKGIPTRVEFWGEATARKVAADSPADLLLGNNVLAHVPNIDDFVEGMRIALKTDGTITMEFQHLLKIIALNQWDTIYHEHFSYLSFATATRIFEAHGLRLFDVEEIPTHGGSLRIYGCHSDNSRQLSDAAGELLERERAAGLEDVETYLDFGARVIQDKRQILEFLIDLKREGASIAAYGAAAKGNTLLNYCGVARDFLDFACDANPHKQQHLLPGTHIPILAPAAIRERRPDVVLLMPWNIKDELMQELSYIREWGGRFAARSPELRLFS